MAVPPTGYPVTYPDNGILVDDSGHPLDLGNKIRRVFETVLVPTADQYWNEIGVLLDPRNHDLRIWLADNFYDHHLKSYSKSRRKSPIFWQIGLSSGRYSVWLYAHRLTNDSFFQIQNDIVAPKLFHEERQLADLIAAVASSPSTKARQEIASQEEFVQELRTLFDEVRRVAPLWRPTLDDGVLVTMAPLWRLMPRHKVWQKQLKHKWDELVCGEYDWAQLAMHLWPERVVTKMRDGSEPRHRSRP